LSLHSGGGMLQKKTLKKVEKAKKIKKVKPKNMLLNCFCLCIVVAVCCKKNVEKG
jgi:hypothetical protein